MSDGYKIEEVRVLCIKSRPGVGGLYTGIIDIFECGKEYNAEFHNKLDDSLKNFPVAIKDDVGNLHTFLKGEYSLAHNFPLFDEYFTTRDRIRDEIIDSII